MITIVTPKKPQNKKDSSVLQTLFASFADLFRPRVLLFLLLPPILFLILGIWLCIYFWGPMNGVLFDLISRTFLSEWFSISLVTGLLAFFALALIAFPLLMIVTSIFFSVLLVPRLVRVLQSEVFPQVVLKPQVFSLTSLWVTIKLSVLYVLLVVITFPINLLLPPLGVVINWWGLGYFNARLFSREILQEILPSAELEAFLADSNNASALTNMSLIVAFAYFVPGLNFLAPTWTAMALTRICLQRI